MYYSGRLTKNSDKRSNSYVSVNNCGYYDNIPQISVNRPNGRQDYQLIYLKSGNLSVKETDTDVVLNEGFIYLFRPGLPQIYYSKSKASFYWIHFSGTEIEQMLSYFVNNYYQIGEFLEFERFCKSFYIDSRIKNNLNELLYEGELIVLFARLFNKIKPQDLFAEKFSKIQKAVKVMNESPEKRLSNDELSSLCKISKYYFIKLFTDTLGISPQQYYNNIIIDKSKQLLETTDFNVSEISHLLGIEDSLYFSRLFKKREGKSPLNYRKSFRSNTE